MNAFDIFAEYLYKKKGYKGRVKIFTYEVRGNLTDIFCAKPYGCFEVNTTTGEVIDDYGTFVNPEFCRQCATVLASFDAKDEGLCNDCKDRS